jgi:hypothetical protein
MVGGDDGVVAVDGADVLQMSLVLARCLNLILL